ncbi:MULTISPECIES: cytochrome c551 [Halobacillus]|uniref:cytochrome c551 n=1 Tax=Halobacillus TaxID=45667 RepID=UPI00040A201F|nr:MULTISPECIES: cytochrome c [Halobacillus]
MKKLWLAMMLGLILILAACGGGEESSDEDTNEETTEEQSDSSSEDTVDAAAAEEVYQNNCATCHGGDLEGAMGPALTEVGGKYSADEIVNIIKNGKGQMPAQGVSDEDAQLVAGWLAAKQ